MFNNARLIGSLSFIAAVLLLSFFIPNPLFQGFLLLVSLSAFWFVFVWVQDQFKTLEETHKQQIYYLKDKTQKETKTTHEQLDTLINTLSSGFLLIDYEGYMQTVNPAMQNILPERTLKQRHIKTFKDVALLYDPIQESFITEKPIRTQIRLEETAYDIQTSVLHDGHLFMGILVLISDITTLKRAERFQKQFTADVTHELKTPLSTILGFSEILKEDQTIEPTKQKEFIEAIHQEAVRLEQLIRDLLIISKMDRLDYELKKKSQEIKPWLESIIEETRFKCENKGLTLETDIATGDVLFDEEKFRHVILNLVHNAINYSDRGAVSIKGVNEENVYRIDVSDQGIGIDPVERENIFKRFYRMDEARNRDSGGTGLGLSIVKNVVLKHQGSIKLESHKGHGSTFTVTLPKSP